jgi:hypothetical protein
VQDCQVCGRKFDPLSFQVVVPELGRGFDCVECARNARAVGGAVAAAPLAAIVEPFTAAARPAVGAGPSGRRSAAMPVATFGLIAVGAAAAAFLWLRVLGPDTTAFQFSRGAVPPAFARESVQAHVEPSSTHSVTRPAAPATSRRPITVSATALLAGFSPTPSLPGPIQGKRIIRLVARLVPGAFPTQAPESGRGHAKHGKGHLMHGETGGMHSPGHGHHGKHGKGKGKGKH